MKEKDYINVSELKLVSAAREMLRGGNFAENPNKTRYMSVMANLQLMIDSLLDEIQIDEDEQHD